MYQSRFGSARGILAFPEEVYQFTKFTNLKSHLFPGLNSLSTKSLTPGISRDERLFGHLTFLACVLQKKDHYHDCSLGG